MRRYLSLIIIACCLPIIIIGVCGILPTFDDFTTLQSPQFTNIWSKELLPNDSFWRPWDYLFGCLLGWNTSLFPTLNHIVIIIGHSANSLLVYIICKKLNLNIISINIATLFFFFSPASLGATLACDGLNQTYAQFWGLIALWIFLNEHGKKRLFLWGICIMMAALSKENGLAWAVIPPLIAYAFNLMSKKKTVQYLAIGLSFAVFYFILRISLRTSETINNEYIETSWIEHLKDLAQIIVYNWIPVDYMSIFYAPERNWLLITITFLSSLPFLLLIFFSNRTIWKDKTLLILIACFIIVASPHLITLVSIMHNYAPLSMTSMIVAYLISKINNNKWLISFFSIYLLSALLTDIHHTIGALNSGLLGKKLALETIKLTGKPVDYVFCISIEDEITPKYSSFAVRPIDAFAWGLSVRHYNNYLWPSEIKDTILTQNESDNINHIVDSILNTNTQCVWIVNGNHISVRK